MSKKVRFASLLGAACLAAALIPSGASAQDYNPCTDGTFGGIADTPAARGHVVVPVGAHPNVIYIDIRELAGSESTFSVWGYMESNGSVDLQRGDNGETGPLGPAYTALREAGLLNFDDPCVQSSNPDTLIF